MNLKLTPEQKKKFLALSPEKQIKYVEKRLEYKDLCERISRQNSFEYFCSFTFPHALEKWQTIVADRFSLLTKQTGQRILIHKPPQHGGSVMTGQRLIPFYLGVHPEARTRLMTYNISHSERFATVIKSIMQSGEYKKVYPRTIIPERGSLGEWSTTARALIGDSQSSFSALGLDTGFVGSGADLLIIDDPYASREQAFSDTINNKIWNLWNEIIIPRLNPESNVVVMYHTFNEFDFAAKLKESGGWEEMRFAALCDSLNDIAGRELGEPLSIRYPKEYLQVLRDGGYYGDKQYAGIGTAAFESLYQGNPTNRDGQEFKKEWFHYVKDYRRMPKSYFIRSWDWASSPEPTADRTVGSLWYIRPDGTRTKIHCAHGRFSASDTPTFIYNVSKKDKEQYGAIAPVIPFIEKGIAAADVYVKQIMTKCAPFGMRPEPSITDKVTRALPLKAAMEIGNIDIIDDCDLPTNEKWNTVCEQEFLSFPNGKHDDFIDADSLAINLASRLKIG